MANTLIRKISTRDKKGFKVAVIGAASVGKSALTVRIITKRFIHNYAPNTEKQYSCTISCDGETVVTEILDTAALQTAENAGIEEKLKWADAFILMYSVTDAASLPALITSKCLINLYAKSRRKSTSNVNNGDLIVALVGNKNDLAHERCITEERGRLFAEENDCSHFFEISVRESFEEVKTIFDKLYRASRRKIPKLPRPNSGSQTSANKIDKQQEQMMEDLRMISKMRARGRSRTTLEYLPKSTHESAIMSSPGMYKKSYRFSPGRVDEQEQQIIYERVETTSLPRRVTVCHSPVMRGRKNGMCVMQPPLANFAALRENVRDNNNNKTLLEES